MDHEEQQHQDDPDDEGLDDLVDDDDRESDIDGEMMLYESGIARTALLTVGTVSLGLGIIGIFLPVMPTTPFLLLTAGCYARSSRKFYVWLVTNRWFGQTIRDYRAGRGIPRRAKISATVVIAVTFGTSIAFFVPFVWVKVLMVVIAIAVVGYLWSLPTRT